ncbi:WD repeat-containing protein 93-like isoform X2 [Lineus longissimus]|uniref:WD repeat-containing protein 93-like isoform X2 n=1 Tax=Lineus longissimus TaxID=88925 RepID=UPI002B4F4837
MPVYIRENMHIPPPSMMSSYLDDESDFITDPEQMRDQLPQPYRMINKIVAYIFDESWEVAQCREERRILEESRVRPPQYDCGTPMELFGKCGCLADSKDGKFVFIGLQDGLAVVDATNQQTITIWEEEKTEIVTIKTSIMAGGQNYVLSTLDDMGTARVFAFTGEKVYLLKVMNEPQEGGSKVLATKCESSNEGDYIGVALENPTTLERWLEIYRKPENWVKELESVKSQASKTIQTTVNVKAPTPHTDDGRDAPIEISHPSESIGGSTVADEPPLSGQESQRKAPLRKLKSRKSSQSDLGSGSRLNSPVQGGADKQQAYKFSPPSLVLKVKASQPIAYSTANSPFQALSKIDQTGDVIGTGLSHILTASHLELRKTVFEHLHEQHIKYLPQEEEEKVIQPSFHFLHPGRMLPVGLEQSSQAGLPTSVAVWWTGGTQLMHYSLLKSAKDVEHKPDLVWPFSCAITSTTATPDTSIVAIGLENGTVIIMDIRMGIQRRAVSVTDKAKISQLTFLNPNISYQEIKTYPPYPVQTSSYVMVTCDNGFTTLVNTNLSDESTPISVLEKAEEQSDLPSHIEPIESLPELILTVYEDGTIFLQDVLKKMRLCEVVLPDDYELTAPWEPITALGASGKMLFLKGTQKEACEEAEEKESAIFVFPIRSFPVLDSYWRMDREVLPYSVHTKIDDRLESLLRERITVQPFRQARMQKRWEQLRDELEMLQNIREQKKAQSKFVYLEQ